LITGTGSSNIEQRALTLLRVFLFCLAETFKLVLHGDKVAAHADEHNMGELHTLGAVHGHHTDGLMCGELSILSLDCLDSILGQCGDNTVDEGAASGENANADVFA